MNHRFFTVFDIIAILTINIILWISFYIQFTQNELPCPLCLFQRMGIFGISIGYIFNLYFGTKARHYAISSIIALLTTTIGLVQVLMHIVPDTGSYGSPFLGLHLYTWVVILSPLFALANLIAIASLNESSSENKRNKKIALIVIIPLLIGIMANAIAGFAECGFKQCPSDPTQYWISKFFKQKKGHYHEKKH